MSDLEARIAEVLVGNDRAHAFRMADYSDNERPIYRCACGVEAIGMHHEHHREALAAALLATTREAQAEALRDAADLLAPKGILWWGDSGVRVSNGPFGMPQGSLDDWLRARADNLEAS